MGYYSEVAYAVYEKDFKELCDEIANKKLDDVKDMLSDAKIRRAEGEYTSKEIVTIHWDCIKWYLDFNEVEYFKDFFTDRPCYWCEIGEDYDDVHFGGNDDDGDLYDILDIVRYIQVNCGEEESLDSFFKGGTPEVEESNITFEDVSGG